MVCNADEGDPGAFMDRAVVEKMIPKGILENCFVPVRRLRKKFHGAWHEVTEKLFPGYVFMVSEQPQLLYEELKQIPALTKMLGRCEEYFTPLSEKDVRILEGIQKGKNGSRNPEAGISRIAVEEGNQIRILSGPLVALEGQIRKVNLHKRIAVVEVEFMGNNHWCIWGWRWLEKLYNQTPVESAQYSLLQQ